MKRFLASLPHAGIGQREGGGFSCINKQIISHDPVICTLYFCIIMGQHCSDVQKVNLMYFGLNLREGPRLHAYLRGFWAVLGE